MRPSLTVALRGDNGTHATACAGGRFDSELEQNAVGFRGHRVKCKSYLGIRNGLHSLPLHAWGQDCQAAAIPSSGPFERKPS